MLVGSLSCFLFKDRVVSIRVGIANRIMATCLSKRLSRRATGGVHRDVSTTVRLGVPALIVLSFGKVAFVSDSNVKLIVKHCHALRGGNTSLRVANATPGVCGIFGLSKVRGLTGLRDEWWG